jgi:anaerobic magnesium-protoporphyrin IX monomethyl ester cyclase
MYLLLVRPPRRSLSDAGLGVPPLGLAYIAAAARAAGHRVQILDAYVQDMSWSDFEREIAARRPEAVGLTVMTPMVDVIARATQLIRPHAQHIIVGGPHPTAVGADVFDDLPAIDAAVQGEGEEIIAPLLQWLSTDQAQLPPGGVRVRGAEFTASVPPADLSTILRPARDLLPHGAYRYLFATRRGFATMITSRGCPFSCSFCDKSVSGSRWRARGAVDVVDEMAQLAASGVGFINFYDDNFTLQRKRVVAICDEILRRGLDIHWKCEGRVDSVDLQLLQLMARAGCQVVAYGVESANPETLALLRKDIEVGQARSAFAATRQAGLRSLAYMILGAPGETIDDVRRSIDFCREIGADYVQFSSLVAMPGTPLYAHRRSEASVYNPLDSDLSRETMTDLSQEALDLLLRQAWSGFYLRPRPLARLARDAWASGSIGEAWRLGRVLGRWALAA